MSNLPETSNFDTGVYQITTTDPVVGGLSGIANSPLKNLTNRTRWLFDQVNALASGSAALVGAVFTGAVSGLTAVLGDNSLLFATTAWVNKTFGSIFLIATTGDTSTLTAIQAGNGIFNVTGTLISNATVILPASPTRSWIVENNTTGAFTVTFQLLTGTGVIVPQGYSESIYTDGTNIYPVNSITNIFNNVLSLNISGGSDVTLTTYQLKYSIIKFTGVLTSNINIIISGSGKWVFVNNSTGAYNIKFTTGSGSTISTASGAIEHLYCDGTNVASIEERIIGEIRSFGFSTPPPNWIPCPTGPVWELVSSQLYPDLFAAIGYTFGYESGSGGVNPSYALPSIALGGTIRNGGTVGASDVGQNLAHTHTAIQANYSQPDTGTGNSHFGNINGTTATLTGAEGGTSNIAAGTNMLICFRYQ